MLSVAECCTHNATALKRMAFACKAFREGAEQVVATLLGSINDEMSHASRREAASILATDLGFLAVPSLHRISLWLRSSDTYQRYIAAQALGWVGQTTCPRAIVAELVALIVIETDGHVRARAQDTICEIARAQELNAIKAQAVVQMSKYEFLESMYREDVPQVFQSTILNWPTMSDKQKTHACQTKVGTWSRDDRVKFRHFLALNDSSFLQKCNAPALRLSDCLAANVCALDPRRGPARFSIPDKPPDVAANIARLTSADAALCCEAISGVLRMRPADVSNSEVCRLRATSVLLLIAKKSGASHLVGPTLLENVAHALKDVSLTVRQQALDIMEAMGEHVGATHASTVQKEKGARHLATHLQTASVSECFTALAHENPVVRRAAVEGLMAAVCGGLKCDLNKMTKSLFPVLKDEVGVVRLAALETLGEIHSRCSADRQASMEVAMGCCLADPDETVRSAAFSLIYKDDMESAVSKTAKVATSRKPQHGKTAKVTPSQPRAASIVTREGRHSDFSYGTR